MYIQADYFKDIFLHNIWIVWFEALMAETMKITVSWDVIQCDPIWYIVTSIMEVLAASIFCTEDGASRFLWNVCNYLSNYVATHPRRSSGCIWIISYHNILDFTLYFQFFSWVQCIYTLFREVCSRIPSKILGVYIKYSSPRHSCWCSSTQVWNLKQQPHYRSEGYPLIAGKGQNLEKQHLQSYMNTNGFSWDRGNYKYCTTDF